MPEEISLAYGPWKTVFSGAWGGHKTSVYLNPDKLLLALVFDPASPSGALALMKKAFLLEGDCAEFVNFLNSQKRPVNVVEKLSRTRRQKYLLIESEPTFAESVQQELNEVLREQRAFLDSVGKALAAAAPSYGVRVRELSEAGDDAVDALVGDPFSLFLFKQTAFEARPGSGLGSGPGGGPASLAAAKPVAKMFLGIDSGNEFFEPPLREARVATVVGENAARRKRFLHLLCENALLNNVSCIVLASTNFFKGLGEPASDKNGFEGFAMKGDPHGFPLKMLSPSEGLRVDLRLVEPTVFASVLGLNEEAGEAIREALAPSASSLVSTPPSSLEDLKKKLESLDAKKFPASVVRKALRVLELLEEENPFLFQEDKLGVMQKNFGEVGEKTLASVYFIDLSKASREAAQLVACSLAAFLQKLFADSPSSAKQSEPNELNAFIAVEEDAGGLSGASAKALSKASARGVGFALNAASSVDLKDVAATATIEVELVEDQAFATIAGKKTRFTPRPTYSNSSKIV